MQIKQKQRFKWDENTFLDRVDRISGKNVATTCQKLIDSFHQMGCRIYWGEGSKQAGFVPVYDGILNHQLLAVYSYGTTTKVEIYFQHFKVPFQEETKKRELLAKFNRIPGIHISETALTKRPSFDCSILSNKNCFEQFISIYQEMLLEIKQHEVNKL